MSRLDACAASALSLAAVGRGATSVTALVVSPGPAMGARMLVIEEPGGALEQHGGLGDPALDTTAHDLVSAVLGAPGHEGGMHTTTEGTEIYLEIRRPIPELVIVGAGHIARPMARLGSDLGYRIWVLDDRPDFATRERFPDAHRVVRADFSDPFRDVPIHRGTHILLVTRGHKYDYDCLVRIVGRDPAPAYIGMIGSRRRVRATFLQLLEDGVPRGRLDSIHAPVGLDIGAETPEEIAVAVAAELVKVRRGGTGRSLRELEDVARRFFPPEGPPT